MTNNELHAIAQAELTEFRRQTGQGRAYLSSPRLVVLSDRFMRRFGGAAAIWRWTCICPALLHAPTDVRQAVIAHEWGHANAGHCLATMGSLALGLIYSVSTWVAPASWGWVSFNMALLGVICWVLLWVIQPLREFEADAIAARLVGPATMAKGIRWVVDHMRDGKPTETVVGRLAKLDADTATTGDTVC